MTKRECAIVMAFTGVAMLKGDDLDIFYQYLADVMGRPIYTHEIAILADEIKESARQDFIRICHNATYQNPQADRQESKDYCANCNHIEMCRWYPYDGCDFREVSENAED